MKLKCQFEGCETTPIFGFLGKGRVRCSKHKENGMISLARPKCNHTGCPKNAVYGYVNATSVGKKLCRDHKQDGMIDLEKKKCAEDGCFVKAHYGPEGGARSEAILCAKHKLPGYKDLLNQQCAVQGCETQPCYGPFGQTLKAATHCSVHKQGDMVDLRSRKCIAADCIAQAQFGPIGGTSKDGVYCFKHMLPNMINLRSRRCEFSDCPTRSAYGHPGSASLRCHKHRLPGMIVDPKRRCIEASCKDLALYGSLAHEHCEKHKVEGEINLVERPCASCGLLGVLDKESHCETCNPEAFKRVRLAKQNMVRDFLIAHGIIFNSIDRMIDGGACGRERPDFFIDCGTHILIIECDEHQHSGRACECEQTRMVNISQSNGMKRIFLRFNPDTYKVARKGLKQDATSKRLENLLIWTKHWMKTEPQDFLSVMYMYFDEYVYGEEKVETILKMDSESEAN